MWFSKKQKNQLILADEAAAAVAAAAAAARTPAVPALASKQTTTVDSTKQRGDAAERQAERHLLHAGLHLIERNFRTPGRGGGEIDLVMRAPDGTLVFVEVRQRSSASHGGAGASISGVKQQRIVYAARHYLMRFAAPPPCRFDVVLVQGGITGGLRGGPPGGSAPPAVEWLPAAFDAS